ncbi:SDR family NAD(P)-dependent oxidoreductase [Streptomyces narbonensis]
MHAFGCDLSRPAEIREFAARVGERTDRVDLLVNNGARWLDGMDLEAASDAEIVETIEWTAGGTVLMVKHLLPHSAARYAPTSSTWSPSATPRAPPRRSPAPPTRPSGRRRARRPDSPTSSRGGCGPPGFASSRSSRRTSRPRTRDSREWDGSNADGLRPTRS